MIKNIEKELQEIKENINLFSINELQQLIRECPLLNQKSSSLFSQKRILQEVLIKLLDETVRNIEKLENFKK